MVMAVEVCPRSMQSELWHWLSSRSSARLRNASSSTVLDFALSKTSQRRALQSDLLSRRDTSPRSASSSSVPDFGTLRTL